MILFVKLLETIAKPGIMAHPRVYFAVHNWDGLIYGCKIHLSKFLLTRIIRILFLVYTELAPVLV